MVSDVYLFNNRAESDKFPYIRFPHCMSPIILIPLGIMIHIVGGNFAFLGMVFLIIAVPNMFLMYFSTMYWRHQFMSRDVIEMNFNEDTFIERGLKYMGYSTSRINNIGSNDHQILMVNRTIMLCVTKNLTEEDMRKYVTYSITNNIDDVHIITVSMSNRISIPSSVKELSHRHGIVIYSMNDIFDALIKKVKKDESKK